VQSSRPVTVSLAEQQALAGLARAGAATIAASVWCFKNWDF